MTDVKPSRKNTATKAVSYILGIIFIAIGINTTKLAQIGISPTSSFPRAIEAVTSLSLGTATTIVCIGMVLVQMLILRKRFKPVNILGIPLSIAFGWVIDFFGTDPRTFGHLLAGVPRPETYPMKLLCFIIGISILSFGVFLYSRVMWVLMPTDCKTMVDCTFVFCALMLQLVFLGGFKSFTENVVVREGTVIAAVLVGQVVKLLGKIFGKRETSN